MLRWQVRQDGGASVSERWQAVGMGQDSGASVSERWQAVGVGPHREVINEAICFGYSRSD